MVIVAITDFITLITTVSIIVILAILWKRNLSVYSKIIFVILIGLNFFHSLSNFLEWVILANFLDPYEDFIQVLEPILWFTLFFAFIQEISEKKLRRSEKKFREAFNRAEFYKDLFAHDINNILQNILTTAELCELIEKHPNKLKEGKNLMENIEFQVLRGASLVNNIRRLSDLEELQFIIEPIEFYPILSDILFNLKDKFKNKNIETQVECFNKKSLILANPLIRDVFENIMLNSIHHNNNPKVEILIRISREERNGIGYVKFEFIDNGVGIEDIRKDSIFQREYREDRTFKGQGLGLTVVKKIIDNLNGQIWVKDKIHGEYSKGSNFIIIIPEAF